MPSRRLSGEPGGLESLVPCLVHLDPRHLAVAHGRDVNDRELDVEARMPGPAPEANRHDQLVSGIDELLRLDPHPGERLHLRDHELQQPGVPMNLAALRQEPGRLQDHIRVVMLLDEGLEIRDLPLLIREVEGFVAAPRELEVLLRHPRGVSRGYPRPARLGTKRVPTMKAHMASVAARSRRSPAMPANGSTHTMYQG